MFSGKKIELYCDDIPGLGPRNCASTAKVDATFCESQCGTSPEGSALFTGIPPGDRTQILAAAAAKEFARGAMLHLEGEVVRQVALITSGCVKLNKTGLSGAEAILRLGKAGDIIGVAGMYSTGTHCATAIAFRSCRVLVWNLSDFKALLARFPALQMNLVRVLGSQLMELESRFHEVATQRVALRVASQLVRLLETVGRPVAGGVDIELSREELGQMTGTTLFTVSRLFSSWETRGMVRPRREGLTVYDVQSLRALAEED